jgi:uncharacterized RDD family membrane protein YckC
MTGPTPRGSGGSKPRTSKPRASKSGAAKSAADKSGVNTVGTDKLGSAKIGARKAAPSRSGASVNSVNSASASRPLRRPAPVETVRGARLGLPETGPGSLATFGRRSAAFAIDALLSALVASIFVQVDSTLPGIAGRAPGWWSLLPLGVMYVLGLLLAGRTLGQFVLGLRVIRVDRHAPVTPWRAVVRTALLLVLVPAVIVDRDGRGMHDRVTDTAVIRA